MPDQVLSNASQQGAAVQRRSADRAPLLFVRAIFGEAYICQIAHNPLIVLMGFW
jgi:hypothetical protein